jgi:hypothetical protein
MSDIRVEYSEPIRLAVLHRKCERREQADTGENFNDLCFAALLARRKVLQRPNP